MEVNDSASADQVSSTSQPDEAGISALAPATSGAATDGGGGGGDDKDDDSSANNKNKKDYSASAAETAQLHALTRETYTMSLRQLRQERLMWRGDKLELEHLRKLLTSDNPISTSTQFQTLLKEKAEQEVQLEACHEEIQALKEQVHSMQTEHKELKKALADSQQQLQGQRSSQRHLGASSQYDQSTSDARRIQDLEEQINKWEVLFFESAEMGERQIERLEQELEQVREELAETKELSSLAPISSSNNSKKIMEDDRKVATLQEQVHLLEEELSQKDEQLESERKSAQRREDDLLEQIQELSNKKSAPTSIVAPDPFADRLASLAKEMNNRESATLKQHEAEHQTSKKKMDSLKAQLNKANQKITQLERQVEMSMVIHEGQDEDDNSNSASSAGNGDLEQYVVDLEKQLGDQKKEFQELTDRLDQERLVAKNRENALKRQLEEAQEATAVAKNRETLLDQELKERKPRINGNADIDNVIMEGLLDEVQQTKEELEKSQTVAKELRQKLEIALQTKTLVAQTSSGDKAPRSGSTSQGEWDTERKKLLARIDSQQQELEEANGRLAATQRENSQLRQVKDSLMGIDREMEDLIESLEPLQNELAEQTRRAEEARDEAAALKQELNGETVKRQEAEREKRKLEETVVETKERLNQVYIELKDEQALREEEVDRAKQEHACMKESLEYHKTNLEVLQDALREANEEIRSSTPRPPISELDHVKDKQANKEIEKVRIERDELKNIVQNLTVEMKKASEMANKELTLLRQKLAELESEKDALELEASMAMQEKSSIEENLRHSSRTIASLELQMNGRNKSDKGVHDEEPPGRLRGEDTEILEHEVKRTSLKSQLESLDHPPASRRSVRDHVIQSMEEASVGKGKSSHSSSSKKPRNEEPQLPRISVKDMLQNYQK